MATSSPTGPGYKSTLRALSPDESPVTWPAGHELFRQGEQPTILYVLEDGTVKLVKSDPAGRRVTAALRTRGWLLGVSACLLDITHPVTAVTLGPCVAWRVRAGVFREACARDARLALQSAQLLAREVCGHLDEALRHRLSTTDRLLSLLLRLAKSTGPPTDGGWVQVHVPLSHSELADLVCASRRHVIRALKGLGATGRIKVRNGWFFVRPPKPL
jgi:CRP-like cAMP-binding protein